uniref:Uncharacterized protein n=1 Tax=Leersia perrieri TaxID=77586 RepID=A0A0D9V4J9_9ORYZ
MVSTARGSSERNVLTRNPWTRYRTGRYRKKARISAPDEGTPSSSATSRAALQKKSITRTEGLASARKSRRLGLERRVTSKVSVSWCLHAAGGSSTFGRRWNVMAGLAAETPARNGPVAPVLPYGGSTTTTVTARSRAAKILPSSIMETRWPMPGDG